MGAAMMQLRSVESRETEQGFSMIEVVIAMAIVTIGLVALVAVFGVAVSATKSAQEDLIAKQKALEAMESVFTARNTQQITFSQIANISSGGIFTDGLTPLLGAGPDGLVGTGDDVPVPGCPGGVECLTLPGPDGILGTADDTQMSLANFSRKIQINTVLEPDGVTINPNLRQITITVQYTKAGLPAPRVYTATSLISTYR
jgi:prepilin-type N-terminal cleavage/methylation domain-containing protein